METLIYFMLIFGFIVAITLTVCLHQTKASVNKLKHDFVKETYAEDVTNITLPHTGIDTLIRFGKEKLLAGSVKKTVFDPLMYTDVDTFLLATTSDVGTFRERFEIHKNMDDFTPWSVVLQRIRNTVTLSDFNDILRNLNLNSAKIYLSRSRVIIVEDGIVHMFGDFPNQCTLNMDKSSVTVDDTDYAYSEDGHFHSIKTILQSNNVDIFDFHDGGAGEDDDIHFYLSQVVPSLDGTLGIKGNSPVTFSIGFPNQFT